MANMTPKIGFSYFSSKEYLLNHQSANLVFCLTKLGCIACDSYAANFDLAIPEDVFISAQYHGWNPLFTLNHTCLPRGCSMKAPSFWIFTENGAHPMLFWVIDPTLSLVGRWLDGMMMGWWRTFLIDSFPWQIMHSRSG
jgi:hypothetical protein